MKTKVIIEENGEKKFIFEIDGKVEITKTNGERKVTIEFKQKDPLPKDGDIIYVKLKNDFEYICVFKTINGTMLRTYCDKSLSTGTVWTFDAEACFLSHIDQIKEIRLATEEQKKILFDGLASEGKRWNEQDKVLEDITKVGDLCIFWNDNKENAVVQFLKQCNDGKFYDLEYCGWKHCIKFESEGQLKKFISL